MARRPHRLVSGLVAGLAMPLVAAVSASAAPPTTEVKVVNTPIEAVPVLIENPGEMSADLTPVQFCDDGSGTSGFRVPAGQVLVIEDGTVSARLAAGEQVLGFVSTIVGGEFAQHFIGRTDGDIFTFDAAARTMTVFADPETEVVTSFAFRGAPQDVLICLSGRLVPAADGG